jgi:hypothetical protein
VVELRRCSGGFCSTAMLGRGAGDLGEAACKVCVEIRFQGVARKAAGGALESASFGLGWTRRSAACLDKATVSEDTPDQRKKFRRKGRGLAYLGSSDSSGFGRRHLRSPARNPSVAR